MRKLVPIMLFLMPALASVAITAGVHLAGREGLGFLSPPIIAAGIGVIILSVQDDRMRAEIQRIAPEADRLQAGVAQNALEVA